MNKAFVIDAVRTPIGKYGGTLSAIRPDDLLAHVIIALMLRNETIDPEAIEDVIAGDANQAGEDNRNVARMAALLAGLPVSVAGNTVNRLCGSGLQAVMDAARAIMCGEGDLYIAGGVESMSRAPFILAKTVAAFGRQAELVDSTIGWRFPNPKLVKEYYPFSMGETAENIAERWKISRAAQDEYAFESQQKYAAARAAGIWEEEIAAIELERNRLINWISRDEPPRETSIELLSRLKPAFRENGTVTAGNASGLNDGAAALLLASAEAVKRYDLQPIAEIKSMAVAGVDPAIMGIGSVPAIQKALMRAGWKKEELDLVELNEAFAAQAIACLFELGLDLQKVNVNGGAIAMGNPMGAGGARIATTLLHEMRRRGAKKGLASIATGLGQGVAMTFEAM